MLRPEATNVGRLCDATELTLILPHGENDEIMLVTLEGDAAQAVFLRGPYANSAFGCADNDSWGGLMITGIRVELDPTSLFDPNRASIPLGSMIRHGDRLSLVVNTKEQRGFTNQVRLPIMSGLPPTAERAQAGFRNWRLVVGEGYDKQTVYEAVPAQPVIG